MNNITTSVNMLGFVNNRNILEREIRAIFFQEAHNDCYSFTMYIVLKIIASPLVAQKNPYSSQLLKVLADHVDKNTEKLFDLLFLWCVKYW